MENKDVQSGRRRRQLKRRGKRERKGGGGEQKIIARGRGIKREEGKGIFNLRRKRRGRERGED